MASLQALNRWFRLKQYQVEVTFGVYIWSPVEKFAFYSVVFLLFGLTFIATVLYLPQHIVFLIDRAWFYVHGEESGVEVLRGIAKTATRLAAMASSSAVDDASETVGAVVREL